MMMVFGMKGNRRQTDFRFYKISVGIQSRNFNHNVINAVNGNAADKVQLILKRASFHLSHGTYLYYFVPWNHNTSRVLSQSPKKSNYNSQMQIQRSL